MKRIFSSKIFLCLICFAAGLIVAILLMKNDLLPFPKDTYQASRPFPDQDPLSDEMDTFVKKFQANPDDHQNLFDDFFDDDFFQRFNNPFQEMDSFRKKMKDYFGHLTIPSIQDDFQNHFESWFNSRFGENNTADIQIKEDDNHIYYTLQVDHLNDQNVKVDIKDKHVIISAQIEQEQRLEKNGMNRQGRYTSRYFRSFPAPDNITPDKTEVAVKGDQVSIRFEKAG